MRDTEIKEIQDRLAEIFAADQELRKTEVESLLHDENLDRKHADFAKEVIEQFGGWPSVEEIGETSAHQLWLIVQHADLDPAFQSQCLDLMKKLRSDEVDSKDVAFLEDRVRVNSGKSQHYGTQYYVNETGQYGPRPIEDIENLDKRRASMELGSFAEYDQLIRKTYHKSQ